MEGYRISKSWLTKKLDPGDSEWSWAVERLRPDFDQGDELWHFDEPALPGVNTRARHLVPIAQWSANHDDYDRHSLNSRLTTGYPNANCQPS